MMGTLKYVAGVLLTISFIIFVAFFGRLPRLRKTPIGWLYRVLWVQLPSGLRVVDKKLTNGQISLWVLRLASHLWNDRHPLILIFFVLLLGVSEVMFLPPAWPLLSNSQKCLAWIAVGLPWIFLYASAATDPGYINKANHSLQMALYPFDFTTFYPGMTCRTCQMLKPARSKHCSICKRCISKLDHHCIFINNCVGYRNHHYFILLVLSTTFLTTCATYFGMSLLSEMVRKQFPGWNIRGIGYSWTQYTSALAWALNKEVGIGSITLLCLFTSPMISGLLIYHLYLIWAGTTTNETMKWSDLSSDMSDGFAFRRNLSLHRKRDERYEPLWTRWPKESEHIISRSYDGQTPNPNIIGYGKWERVWSLADIPNLYDLGFYNNLRDIFWPVYTFKRVNQAEDPSTSDLSCKNCPTSTDNQ
ncbi:Palmitoyltransferase SWF1 [Golovinomyces cichoracearum]|uniref:Palmitoyltransferase n=1 Tax=Golovinomyces cichoracearum TaxID=62708 RepID=A0A420H723_9PEZI|nr:Palmitoyltransferase SWF1 [Golovinomyces cichoracearum]